MQTIEVTQVRALMLKLIKLANQLEERARSDQRLALVAVRTSTRWSGRMTDLHIRKSRIVVMAWRASLAFTMASAILDGRSQMTQ